MQRNEVLMTRRAVITLTTDFGLEDEYVGALKGVLLSFLPDVQIIDISHAIRPHDIEGASGILARSCIFFPDSTVHLAVVDPGVGSDRALLALRTDRHIFVGPDNGIFSSFLLADPVRIHRISNDSLSLCSVSPTFHGRDILAPVAAQLAGGLDIGKVGPEIGRGNCCLLNMCRPEITAERLVGEIVSRDHFGNLRTNISALDIRRFAGKESVILEIGAQIITGLSVTYAGTEKGNVIALVDSSGSVEIAVVCGNAWQEINAHCGQKVVVRRGKGLTGSSYDAL